MQRRILLNHDSKHRCQSLSYSAQSSPWYTATTFSDAENHFPGSRAFIVGNRKKSPGCQVWTVRRVGQQLHRSPPQKIHCQMGGMDRGIVTVQQDAPQSSSWELFGETVGGQLWCTTVQSLSFDAQVVLLPHDHLQ